MDLGAYVQTLTPEQKKAYAKRAGISRVYLSQIVTGFRTASPKTARKLHEASGCVVPLHKLRPDVWPSTDGKTRTSPLHGLTRNA